MNRSILQKIFLLVLFGWTFLPLTEARVVKGRVTCGKEKIENVLVTDGTSLVTTNARGKFEIDLDEKADFVYIITPKGFTVPFESGAPVFYKKVTKEDSYDFELLRTPLSDDYSLIAMADPQTANEEHFALFQQKVMPDYLATVRQQKEKYENTVGIVLGDIVWDNMGLMPRFKEEFARAGIPVYPVIGNHDYVKEAKGDHDTAEGYRESFGPENYAFNLCGDYVIVLDNIVYDTHKHYVETLTDEQLLWVKQLLTYIPQDAHIWVGMHCPIRRWFSEERPWLGQGQKLIELLQGREYTILTGHTHINNINVLDREADRLEHNIATACGTWWTTDHCSDGTPGGYKVFEKKDGKISWYYKSLGKEKDFQMEVYSPGESERHPDAVIANVWDYDYQWKVEWYQDGKLMGEMEQVIDVSPYFIRELNAVYADQGKKTPRFKMPRENTHYFMAVPSEDAKEVKVVVTDRFGGKHMQTVRVEKSKYVFTEASELTLVGKILEDTPNPYHRVDTCRFKGFTKAENNQVRCSAGLAVLFSTNSSVITVQGKYGYANMGLNTMGIALRGYDLYIKENGKWVYASAKCPPDKDRSANTVLIKGMDNTVKECMLYLPMYSEMYSVKIGIERGAEIHPLESPFRHRIGIFGSSFTQGISASRAGMSYPMQFMRETGLQLLSLGCSGNSKLQPYFAEVLKAADVDALIFDAFSNPNSGLIKERLFPFIEIIQETHPDIPLIFMQTIYREGRNFSKSTDQYEREKMEVAEKMMEEAQRKYENVYFIYPNTGKEARESSVDGIHPSDMGYQAWARSMIKPVMEILSKYGLD